MIKQLKDKVLGGSMLTRQEALWLCSAPLEPLCRAADAVRAHYCGNVFDICAIVNAKSGRCSENCRFCAQSAHYPTNADDYNLMDADSLVDQAQKDAAAGVLRFSLVMSGRRLSDQEVDAVCTAVERIRRTTGLAVCTSGGLLAAEAFAKLKAAGVSRVHNNLETSRRFFPKVCTTHTYRDKIAAIRAAQAAGLSVCSGGILGMGETWEDRIDMALTLRTLGVKSVPINRLNPIPGTPLAAADGISDDDLCRAVAIYRLLLPDAAIRLAGGRGLLPDKGRACFASGANAVISGDMLTTAGDTIASDLAMIGAMGFRKGLYHG